MAYAVCNALITSAGLFLSAFSSARTAFLEYLETDLGVPWFVVPLVFVVLVGTTVYYLLRLRRETVPHANEITG